MNGVANNKERTHSHANRKGMSKPTSTATPTSFTCNNNHANRKRMNEPTSSATTISCTYNASQTVRDG